MTEIFFFLIAIHHCVYFSAFNSAQNVQKHVLHFLPLKAG